MMNFSLVVSIVLAIVLIAVIVVQHVKYKNIKNEFANM